MPSFTIHAINKEGFRVEVHCEDAGTYDLMIAKLTDPDYGYTPVSAIPTSQAPTSTSSNSDLACDFCGKEVKPLEKFGNMKSDMSAEDVIKSRGGKFEKMGEGFKKCCSNCWNKGGHKKRWDAWYSANHS